MFSSFCCCLFHPISLSLSFVATLSQRLFLSSSIILIFFSVMPIIFRSDCFCFCFFFTDLYRVMQSTCHSNASIVHDYSNTRGHEIDILNYTLAIVATVVHIARRRFQEGLLYFIIMYVRKGELQILFCFLFGFTFYYINRTPAVIKQITSTISFILLYFICFVYILFWFFLIHYIFDLLFVIFSLLLFVTHCSSPGNQDSNSPILIPRIFKDLF